ncbi:MAG: SH3 domain-containing protein [Pyrinomonadaceae bacterium]
MKILLLFCVFVFAFAEAAAQERYVQPVDEAKMDASFAAFRTKLIAAAERRDAKFVLSILDPKISLSFGGDAGIADFKRIWKIGDSKSLFWDEFLTVIRNGGTFVREKKRRTNLFYAPYSFDSFPADLDAFEHSIIFGNNVNLRERPSNDSKILDHLSYNIVKIDNDGTVMKAGGSDVADWYSIKTLGGKTGYVKAEFVRSPIDFRAGFEKKRGVWKMVAFIAGD